MTRPARSYRYTAVPGFFQHDNEPEGPEFRAVTIPNLGLLSPEPSSNKADDRKPQWDQFLAQLGELNEQGASRYKLFFVIRHGEGDHNVKEAQVGRTEWERHWAKLNGDDNMTWFDAHLTARGKQQAKAIAEFLEVSAVDTGLPLPRRRYTSPLARCLETTRLAFSTRTAVAGNSRPMVKEGLRERLGIHTCDKRHARGWIAENYPEFEIEDGFEENDTLWKEDIRESAEEHVMRIKEVLKDIFEHEEEILVSLTAHSGAIRALYAAIGHREVWVSAGALVPVLIKAEPE